MRFPTELEVRETRKTKRSYWEIVGAFLYQTDKGIVARIMPSEYDNEELIAMAETVQQVCIACRTVFESTKYLTYNYHQVALVIRVISTHQLLIAVTRASYDYDLLIASVDEMMVGFRMLISRET